MANVILQPCGDRLAIEHFHTITEGVSLAFIKKSLVNKNTIKELRSLYADGKIPVWGVERKTGINETKWKRIRPGDVAFFYRHKTLIAWGVVIITMQNEDVARHLWGSNENGSTWEYMYFLQNIKPFQIPVDGLNETLGYNPDRPVQGFTVLDDEKSRLALEYFGFIAPRVERPEGVNRANLGKRLQKLETTDKQTSARFRREQDILKEYLFGDKQYFKCAICGEEFPVSFLVAAHIKKRSWCSLDERKNPHVVMPLCKMGCDHLYEYGYLSVSRGKVVAIRRSPVTKFKRNYVADVVGKDCSHYGENSHSFFQYHYDFNVGMKKNLLPKYYNHE